MNHDAHGPALVGRLLATIASQPARKAAELAIGLGAARTTVFAAISRLEAAGLVERDARGAIWPGPMAARLGYAAFGLARIAGAAEALLPALRDDQECRAELVAEGEAGAVVLAHRSPASAPVEGLGETVEAALVAPIPARVRLRLRNGASDSEKAAALQAARAVANAFSEQLRLQET